MIDEELTGKIISAFYSVYNTLGHGFIESIYHNAMIIEMVKRGLSVEIEKPITVYYGANVVGTFEADLVVEHRVIVELKAKERLVRRTKPSLQITSARPMWRSVCCSTSASRPRSSESFLRTSTSDTKTKIQITLFGHCSRINVGVFNAYPSKSVQSVKSVFKKPPPVNAISSLLRQFDHRIV